ncbi:MAG: methyltransferase domain-containing protein [Candidatus Gottesmanbacteria bacterium]|nr:methyltransferase domain-containing protein [Candidatus Gottesmanbacteria bacterium]
MKKILKHIYDTCYDINLNIDGSNAKDAHFWAETSKTRFALTAEKIINYSDKKEKIRILNASGLGSGDHDISIVKYLKDSGFSFEWDVYDSPDNPYLEKEKLKNYINGLNINLMFFDYAKIPHQDGKKYDVILFTEIAEHLDHSILLKALNYLNEKIEDDGKIIITTPNMLWSVARFKNLFGFEGNEFYGEGNLNLDKNVYGHIVYYTPQRLQRLVEDCGFKKVELFTFDWLPAPLFANFISLFAKASKGTIFLSVTKDNNNKRKIPFAV